MVNKRLINTGVAVAAFDPLQNFETVTYTGNGGTQKITGYIRKGAAFNGSSSYIDVSYPYANSTFSISLWFKANSIATAGAGVTTIISGRLNGTNTNVGNIWIDSQKMRIHSTTKYADITYSFNTNQWYHIGIIYDSSNFYGIVNGSILTPTNVTSYSGTNNTLRIGDSSYSGSIDQVRLFNKTLSSGEVTTLYGETYASSTVSTTDIFGDGSGVALYELDEDANDTGGTYNGTPTNVNFLGMAFQPDFVWVKGRSFTIDHAAFDSVRGAQKYISPSTTGAEGTYGTVLTSFDSNGFTVGSNSGVNSTNQTYVAWCWKGGGTAVSNTDGTITSTVSANQAAGFSIVKYTGGGTGTQTVGHGLSSAPELVIIKNLTDTEQWIIWHKDFTASEYLQFTTTTKQSFSNIWGGTPSNSVIYVGSDRWGTMSGSSKNYISYNFHSVDGYQKVGSYTGNNTTNVVTTGFQPRFVMVKASSHTSSWYIVDSSRTDDKFLSPDLSNAEYTDAGKINFTSTGFTLTSISYNNSGYTWIYLAIA
jgi:hypothetical protein